VATLKTLIALGIAATALAIATTSASAATTRAEYVAQVDPICHAAAKPTAKVANRFLKDLGRIGKAENPSKKRAKAFLNELARVLTRLSSIEANVTVQVATVPPAPGDEPTVSAWLQGRTQYSQLTAQGARAFRHHKFLAAANLLQQADTALAQEQQTISGFGFQHCT
jgi:hypothetical protein